MVSNLSKTLSGDEASYTVNIGILPLPDLASSDSMRYFVIIERVIESNHTDNSVRLERFHKEFAAKVGEPVFLRLTDERPAKGEYIVQLESGKVLDFYDDFSRFIEEHIILKSDQLSFNLGSQNISDISGRLSIPYSVAKTCEAKVQLLSVVDTAHPLTIVDTLREPADYLAEVDMSKFSTAPTNTASPRSNKGREKCSLAKRMISRKLRRSISRGAAALSHRTRSKLVENKSIGPNC